MLPGAVLALGPSWLHPQTLLGDYGLPALLLVVFAETGLLVGFFLPGDSLVFTAGLLIATGVLHASLWLAALLVAVAAVLGGQVGYLIGRVLGPRAFGRPDSRFLKRAYVDRAEAFFDRYGGRTIFLARFVPVVRTFAPVVAGVAEMPLRVFTAWNVLGGVVWGAGVLVLGHVLGRVAFIRDHIEVLLLVVVVVSVVPVGLEVLRERRRSRDEAREHRVGGRADHGAAGRTSGPAQGSARAGGRPEGAPSHATRRARLDAERAGRD